MKDVKRLKPSVEIAMQHAAKIRLLDVSCFALRAHVAPIPGGGTLRYKIEPASVDWHASGGDWNVLMPLELGVEYEVSDEGDKLPIGTIAITMNLRYRMRTAEQAIPDEAIPHVLGVNAYMHSWPYFRADVQLLTAKFGLPALTLPVLLSGEVPDKVLVAASAFILEAAPQPTPGKVSKGRKARRS